MASLYLGTPSVQTVTVFFDDVYLSATSGDYPIGEGSIVGLRPNADGTHNNAANIMEDSAGNDINGTTVFAYDKLDESPWTTTANADYVRQTSNGTGNYCEVQFADTSGPTIKGVSALLQYASASTTANRGACIIRSNTTETTVWGAPGSTADYSETTAFYKSAIVSPDGGAWDQTKVNALRARFGYSDDANPDPYWLALILEVETGPSIQTVTLDTLTLAGSVPALGLVTGPITVILDTLTLAGSVPVMDVAPVTTIALQTLTLAGSTPALDAIPGAATVTLDTLTLAGSAPASDAVPGAVTIALSTLTLTGSVPASLIEVSVRLYTVTLAGSAPALAVLPGAVTITLSTLTLAGSVPMLDVAPLVTPIMQTLTLAGSTPALTVVTTGTPQTVPLDTLTLAASAVSLTVNPGAVTATLNTLTLAGNAPALAVNPGAVIISVNTLLLSGNNPASSVIAVSNQTVSLNTLYLHSILIALMMGFTRAKKSMWKHDF